MRSEKNALEAEIQQLDDLGLDELRKLCGPVLGAVPVNHGAHLLRRRRMDGGGGGPREECAC